MELIDFDGLFDQKLTEAMEENAGKYTEKQWESMIPKLYKKFGDTYLKRVGNTPKGYYAAMSDSELVDCLKAHVGKDVPVSDFLCREIENRNCPDGLVELLQAGDEQLLTFAVNLAGGNPKAFDAYFELLKGEIDGEIKDAICDQLKQDADSAKKKALEFYKEGIEPELMLEILSRCKERDEEVFTTLLRAFKEATDELPIRASYLAAYGDDRALPVLLEYIDRDETNFLEYQELKYAIEALGGRYEKERDFSDDPYFLEVQAQSQLMPEFTDEGIKKS